MNKVLKRILIAEDDPFIGKIMKHSLEEDGYLVDQVSDGVQALEMIEINVYTVILLDLMMPEKNGFEVLAELKEKKNKIPILVFSNLGQEEDKKEVKSLGAKGYYIKAEMAPSKIAEVIKKY